MKTRPFLLRCLIIVILSGFFYRTATGQETKECKSKAKIEVKDMEAMKALVIKADIATSEVGPKMGEIYEFLFNYMMQNQISPVGPPFAVYLSFEPEGNTVFEAGLPVAEETAGSGEVEYREYPATKVVSLLYTGSYEKMMPAYEEIMQYISDNNIKDKGISWETYLTDPNEEPDPEKNQTIISFPIE
ncbi:MAG: GyrI-like domain-containing protein [Bacteroidales bacterium]|nr:GyrI-like domain-containing protein [Bacteroidales bacterium]